MAVTGAPEQHRKARLRSLARVIANSPIAASDAARRWSADPHRLRLVIGRRFGAVGRVIPGGTASHDPAHPLAGADLRRHIGVLIADGQLGQAASELDQLPPADPHTILLKARLFRARGQFDSALDAARSLTGHRPVGRSARRLIRALESERELLSPGTVNTGTKDTSVALIAPLRGRVLHIVTNSLPLTRAGYTIRTQELVTAQRARGIDAHVVTRLGYPVTAGFLRAEVDVSVNGVPYHRLLTGRPLPASPVNRLRHGVDQTEAWVRHLRPALVHAATDHVNGQLACEVSRRTGIPFAYEVRGFLEDSWLSRHSNDPEAQTSPMYVLSRDAETWVMQRASLVTTLGEAMRSEIVSRGVEPDRVIVTPNGVDERFLRDDIDGAGVREHLGIAPDTVTVGLVSTFFEHEGIGTLIDAVAQLVRDGVPVHLLLVGDGTTDTALRSQVQRLDLDAHTSMPGWVPFAEIDRWYAALDLFCVPRVRSRVTELVSPLKPIEAMAVGRPMLASDVGGLREVITPSGGGVLVAPDDSTAWASAIDHLVRNPSERERLGTAGREWVRANRTWSAIANTYLDAYRALGTM